PSPFTGWGLLYLLALMLTACNLRVDSESTATIALPTALVIPAATPTRTPDIAFTPVVIDHLRTVYALGQGRGNRPDVFSKIGDSITVSPMYLQALGDELYTLDEYGHLQAVITHFSATTARTGNSFTNQSLAATVGWAANAALIPYNANGALCRIGETPLDCEYRLVQPSFALVMFGTNDVGYRFAEEYRQDLTRIVQRSEELGIIALLSTIPARPGYDVNVDAFNTVVRDVAAAHSLPVWEYGAALAALPNRGLSGDNVHPSSPPGGYNSAGDFRADNLCYGYVVRNLTALQLLDSVWLAVQ
ncbi:MAG: hypothetical protein H7Y11_08240, partial [Armatimonadetes bacterium]|nr:hypothetical protein [Anaerolineae bacterium]